MKLKNTHKSKIREHKLANDLYLAHIDNFTDSTDTIVKGIDKRYIQFYFCTKGSLTFNFNNGNYKINLLSGSSFIFYNPALELPLNLNVNAESKVCIVVLSIQKLHNIFSEYNIQTEFINSQNADKYYKQKDFSSTIRMVLSQIEHYHLSPQFENLYLIGKTFELFTLYFSETEESEKENCPYLDNEKNARKLKDAREILLNDLFSPPSLKELSEKVKLSEYHLKEGFKQVYGNTVYGFVLDQKLEIAREKLELNTMKVKEIAFEVGYENPSHFIAAFKKKYGITPKQFSIQLQN